MAVEAPGILNEEAEQMAARNSRRAEQLIDL